MYLFIQNVALADCVSTHTSLNDRALFSLALKRIKTKLMAKTTHRGFRAGYPQPSNVSESLRGLQRDDSILGIRGCVENRSRKPRSDSRTRILQLLEDVQMTWWQLYEVSLIRHRLRHRSRDLRPDTSSWNNETYAVDTVRPDWFLLLLLRGFAEIAPKLNDLLINLITANRPVRDNHKLAIDNRCEKRWFNYSIWQMGTEVQLIVQTI